MDKCGALNRSGSSCRNIAGKGTDHVGQGRCKYHGGASLVKHGRYSTINRARISELVQAFTADPEPLNLLPEVALLRSLIVDFVERYDEMTDAILAWHESFELKNRTPVDFIEALRRTMDALEADWAEREGELSDGRKEDLAKVRLLAIALFAPWDEGKPRRIIDIIDVANLVDKVGKTVERIEKQTNDIAQHPEFRRITREMAKHVIANVPDDAARLRIITGWEAIPRQGAKEDDLQMRR